MRKIRLSDTDFDLFDVEISPTDYTFYTRHKDAFKTMWSEQGKQFWIRFVITFRSFTVRHGVIKQMNIDSPKFQNLIDQAFIYIQEQFVEGKVSAAKNFLEDVALLAQNQDKFAGLDSKSFSKDPFYNRGTRELFRKCFGPPDQKTSYLKVYILCPIYLRFGGSVCRCLIRWVEAEPMDPNDISYWNPPSTQLHKSDGHETCEHKICTACNVDCETNFLSEIKYGRHNGPLFVDCWTQGDPRFNDPLNPLFSPHLNTKDDWRKTLCLGSYLDFYQYAKLTYLNVKDQCKECNELRRSCDRLVQAYKSTKKKQKKGERETGSQQEDEDPEEECTCHQITAMLRETIMQKMPLEEKTEPEPIKKKTEHQHKPKEKPVAATDGHVDKVVGIAERKPVFGKDAKVTSDIEYPLGPLSDHKPSKVGGFKVIKIEDDANGVFEVNISVSALKSDEEKVITEKSTAVSPEDFLNKYILTKDLLIAKIIGLPQCLEWWEGKGFTVAVLNYEKEEKELTKQWTNFAIKICGKEEVSIKQMMIKLLFYVAKRKKRPCAGWCMEVDDIVACMLPEDTPGIEDLSISIQRGFRFEDRLLEEERNSLLKHQPNLRLDKVLMGMEPGDVQKMLKKKNGKERLRKGLEACVGKEKYNSNLPEINEEHLRKKLNKDELTDVDILWEQVMTNPDKTEFFVLMEREKEFDLWEYGLKTMDIRYFMSNKNPKQRICPTCKIVDQDCSCDAPMCVAPDISQFIDKSNFQDVKLLGELDELEVPKMAYKELNTFKLDNDNGKQTMAKDKKRKKTKDKVIELNETPGRFKEVGIVTEKTTVTLPAKQDVTLMGNTPMNMVNNVDKMAPIPGSLSSLNFTFHNGKKEQTISVSLGAYMPEDKLNLIAENEKLTKLYKDFEELEDKKTSSNAEKKEKKKSNKTSNKGMKDEVTTKEKQAELTALFLNEVIGNPEGKNAEKQLNQHLGLSHKKQQENKTSAVWSKFVDDSKHAITAADSEVTTGDSNDKPDTPVTDRHRGIDTQDMTSVTDGIANVNLNNKCENDTEKTRQVSEDSTTGDDDDMRKVDEENDVLNKKEDNNDGNFRIKKDSLDKESGGRCGSETQGSTMETNSQDSKNELKKCWNCDILEPKRKTFKKCQKCKEEGVENCRYYCGRDCQVADWKNRHKLEHKCGSFNH